MVYSVSRAKKSSDMALGFHGSNASSGGGMIQRLTSCAFMRWQRKTETFGI
jgi:hypothetical protein